MHKRRAPLQDYIISARAAARRLLPRYLPIPVHDGLVCAIRYPILFYGAGPAQTIRVCCIGMEGPHDTIVLEAKYVILPALPYIASLFQFIDHA
jgi:hypothetical protein